MMQKLANDPAVWLSLTALVGMLITAAAALLALLVAWAKAKTAEYEAKSAKGTAETVAQGQGVQQVTLVQHTAQIAALEAVTTQGPVDRGQATVMPPAAAPVPPAAAVPTVPLPSGTVPPPLSVTTPTGVPLPLSSSPPAPDPSTAGAPLASAPLGQQNGDPPPPQT